MKMASKFQQAETWTVATQIDWERRELVFTLVDADNNTAVVRWDAANARRIGIRLLNESEAIT
jgi:hypothetical protein